MLAHIASMLVGAIIGMIVVPMYAIILRSFQAFLWKEFIQALGNLSVTVLGGGSADYAVTRFVLKSESLGYYIVGLAIVFLYYAKGILEEFLRRRPR